MPEGVERVHVLHVPRYMYLASYSRTRRSNVTITVSDQRFHLLIDLTYLRCCLILVEAKCRTVEVFFSATL